MLQLEDFFTHGDGASVCLGSSIAENAKPSRGTDNNIAKSGTLYLHGPQSVGQTSLLLQYGFTQAKAGRNVVVIMCGDAGSSKYTIPSEIVPITACFTCNTPVQTGEDNNIWGRIHIKYLRSSAELQHFLCSLHIVNKDTSVLLVDGFERFFVDPSHGDVYQTLALLLEAQDYMRTATGLGVTLVTGNTDAFLLQDLSLLRRWCRFLEVVPFLKEPNEFILREEGESGFHVGQIRYKFVPPGDDTNGTFQLLYIQRQEIIQTIN